MYSARDMVASPQEQVEPRTPGVGALIQHGENRILASNGMIMSPVHVNGLRYDNTIWQGGDDVFGHNSGFPLGIEDGARLSAQASAFRPDNVLHNGPGSGNGTADIDGKRNVTELTATSSPLVTSRTLNNTSASSFGAVGSSSAKTSPAQDGLNFGMFDHRHLDHAFIVEGMPTGLGLVEQAQFLSAPSIRGPVPDSVAGKVLVKYTDSRDAEQIKSKIRDTFPEWNIQPLTPKQFAARTHRGPNAGNVGAGKTSNYEGQVKIEASYRKERNAFQRAYEILNDVFKAMGEVRAIRANKISEVSASFHVEFYDTTMADNAVLLINNKDDEGYKFSCNVVDFDTNGSDVVSPPISGLGSLTFREDVPLISPTGRSFLGEMSPHFDGLVPRPFRMSPAPSPGNPSNVVRIENIRNGLDVRTTIMLRNIPNRIDQAQLKGVLDETSFGKYDFMYLRIDFANNCNVGYAFINFEDAFDIIDFAQTRAGKKWNFYGSDKVAEISYATIQGRECLVQKFRNSSVMLENEAFRPKLYSTYTTGHPGIEEAFPGPDNHAKMTRSLENAEVVGLFSPRGRSQARRRGFTPTRPHFDFSPGGMHSPRTVNPPRLLHSPRGPIGYDVNTYPGNGGRY